MKIEQWLSLGLKPEARDAYESGRFRTIEASGTSIIGVPRRDPGHDLLGEAASREEAVVIATILRICAPE
jgi:hypothetical protein